MVVLKKGFAGFLEGLERPEDFKNSTISFRRTEIEMEGKVVDLLAIYVKGLPVSI